MSQGRFRIGRGSVAGLALSLVLTTLLVSCAGGETNVEASAPGISESTTSSTEPFEMAGLPGGSSATTLPDSFLGGGDPTDAGSDLTTGQPPNTTTPPPPPTTFPPPSIPALDAITDLCGFEADYGPFVALLDDSPENVQALMPGLVALVMRYRDVVAGSVGDDLEFVGGTLSRLADVLAANGWDPQSTTFKLEVEQIRATVSDADGFAAKVNRIIAAEHEACD